MSVGITDRAQFARLIDMAQSTGFGHMVELLRPAMRGELNLISPSRQSVSLPFYRVEKRGRPVVAIVSDDDYQTGGPSTWASAAKLRNWARFALIHGSGAEAEQYALVAAMAQQVRRFLLIETSSTAVQAWGAFLAERSPKLPMMAILPRDGGAHPVTPTRSQMQ